MKLNVMGVLRDAWRLFRRDKELLLPVAAGFLFVPQLAMLLVVPSMPQIKLTPDMGEAEQRALAQMLANWISANGGWYLLATILVHFGTLVVLSLYLRADRPDLKAAMTGGLRQFPRFLLAMIVVGLPLGIGLFWVLLLIPALYLLGRLMLTGPILVDRRGSVRAAIRHSWRLTKGNGLVLSGLVSLSVIGGVLLGAPFVMMDQALRASAPNPLAIAIADIGGAAAVAACLLGAVMVQVAAYRRLAANDGI
uniref:glycerophosphoryl diester phosphodiesterase membrane domain-containing protein n=1 Tax=Sphingomonas sp. TaxID=28214 RepID=UPI0025E0C797|nr:glycerophosphoryl diester phosphodiesterase membrane domain-containing protein [Sphingomonas sp.]